MFKLIESQSREMKEILSGGKVVWVKEKELIQSKRLELFNEDQSITIFNTGYDWDILEIGDVEIRKSDGRQINNDFSVTNSEKTEAIKSSIGLRPYRMTYYNVRKFRGGGGKLNPAIKRFSYLISPLKEVA